jgi:3-oxoacyl-[acyl-carrier protein] reductase
MFLDSLKNKNIVITGCNKGIGKAAIEDFAKYGANIFACARTISKDFKNFILDLKKKYKVEIHIIELNLSNTKSVRSSFEQINKFNKNIDVLINNAGMLFNSLFQMTSEKTIKEIYQVNYFSQVYFSQLISRLMAKNKKGNIIFISSTSGINGDQGRFVYSSTKAAIINTVKTLSKELSNYNIRVNAISPGLTKTDLMINNTKEQIIKSEIDNIALKRIADVKEISNVILFLASDSSSYINGQNLVVDGGRL